MLIIYSAIYSRHISYCTTLYRPSAGVNPSSTLKRSISTQRKERMHTHTVREGLAALQALDLSKVRRKLQEPAPEGKGWDDATAQEVEKWYRRFLEMCLRHPEFP